MALLKLPRPFDRSRWAALVAIAASVAPATGAHAQSITQDEALALAFPDADIERHTAYLTEDEVARAAARAGRDVAVEASVVTYYVATRGGAPVGVAYFDAHRVRTLPQVLMIVVDPHDRVGRVETVTFREPPEYRAPDGWLRQFVERRLDDGLSLRGDIAGITGATLTAGAVADAVRRVLALHEVIDPAIGSGS